MTVISETHILDIKTLAYGACGHLPAGIVKTSHPFTELDFTVTGFETEHGSMNARAADDLLFNIVSNARAGMPPEGRLFVVMGEDHIRSSHIMLQAGLVENFITAQDAQEHQWQTAFSLEAPYNNLAKYLINKFEIPMSGVLAEHFHEYDPDGALYMQNMLADNRTDGAAQAINRRFDSLLRRKTSLLLIDASYEKIEAEVPLGPDGQPNYIEIAKFRNVEMAERASNCDADVNIIAVGTNHLGNNTLNLCFQTSVQGQLVEKIMPQDHIVTIFPTASSSDLKPEITSLPDTHPQVTQVILRGLAEASFRRGEDEAETKFIQKLGETYLENDIPQRFLSPQLPGRDDYVADMKVLVAELEP